ncbi:MAG: hypothetical protein ISS47_01540 [Candidatus Omnitrophica bacterium]|nr:hypothetical protein [Candidatus Omnitrophota bacterium]
MTSCIVWFIFLCLAHYFSLRPLWLDENFIFENIKNLQFGQLLGPLKDSQAFPRAYLICIKCFSQIFNYRVLSLRFFPLIIMLSAFFVWSKIYARTFANKWHSLLAIFSFASSYYLSYYASELKQYSMDVLVVGFFCLYLIYQRQQVDKKPSRFFIITTFLLSLTLLFSYSSFFVFWIVIYNFLFIVKKNPKFLALLITYTFTCFLFIIFVFSFDIKHTLSTNTLFLYWNDYFLCSDSLYCFIKAFGEGLRRLSVWWFGNSRFFRRAASFFIPFFVFSLFGYGIRSLRNNKFKLWDIDALGLIVFLELFILGIIKKYPFTGERITLFFAPFVFYFIVKGISFLKTNRPLYIGINIFYIVFLIVCSLNSLLTYLRLYN